MSRKPPDYLIYKGRTYSRKSDSSAATSHRFITRVDSVLPKINSEGFKLQRSISTWLNHYVKKRNNHWSGQRSFFGRSKSVINFCCHVFLSHCICRSLSISTFATHEGLVCNGSLQ